eukprot:6357755-Pyramimonas_sp.AAC.1
MGADEACRAFAIPLPLGNLLVNACRLLCRRVRVGRVDGDVVALDAEFRPGPRRLGLLAVAGDDDDEARVRRDEDNADPRGQAPIAMWIRE